ncbi:MAG: hypothetical protein K5Q00_06800, partial [Gammaproteobacteria bacterium]|nr:hypothetical protein [Gammaproteobacteria bacterium]
MDLAEKIRRYANSKPTNKDAHDKVKHDFFSDISDLLKNKTFTVAALTKKLAELEENDRYRLFYRGRKYGNTPKEKASINSEAAQLILELYRAHNIPLTELDLAIIVT